MVTTPRRHSPILCSLRRPCYGVCGRLECTCSLLKHHPTFKFSNYNLQQWYQCAITLCAEISAASLVIQFWDGAKHINVAAWISIIIVLIIILNIFAVIIYGEAEFIFASLKIITILGLLIMAFCVDLGANPRHDRIGFRYWETPGAMRPYIADGATGRFLGFFSTLINAAFSYVGVESVACAAGEAANPRKNIPKACRRVFWRILFFYVLGALAIGVLVPYDSPMLLSAQKSGVKSAAASPWVIAIYDASIPALPHIINAVILSSASSSANAFLYSGSRYLYALAQNRQAPRFLLTCSRRLVPKPLDRHLTIIVNQSFLIQRGSILLCYDHGIHIASDIPVMLFRVQHGF